MPYSWRRNWITPGPVSRRCCARISSNAALCCAMLLGAPPPSPSPLLVPQQALQLLQRFDELCREQSKVGGWVGRTDCAPALPPTTDVCCIQQGHCKRAPDHAAPPPLNARQLPPPQPRHTLATAARLVRHIWWHRARGTSLTDTPGGGCSAAAAGWGGASPPHTHLTL